MTRISGGSHDRLERLSMAHQHRRPTRGARSEDGPKRPARSREDLTEMLRHVGKELYNCAQQAAAIPAANCRTDENPADLRAGAQADALLEAYLIHARNLIELLVRPIGNPAKDDLVRTDFLPKQDVWVPKSGTPAQKAAGRLQSIHWKRINKHLAHLSWERVNAGGIDWDVTGIAKDILTVCAAWGAHLTQHAPELAPSLHPWILWARQALATLGREGLVSTTTGSDAPRGVLGDFRLPGAPA